MSPLSQQLGLTVPPLAAQVTSLKFLSRSYLEEISVVVDAGLIMLKIRNINSSMLAIDVDE